MQVEAAAIAQALGESPMVRASPRFVTRVAAMFASPRWEVVRRVTYSSTGTSTPWPVRRLHVELNGEAQVPLIEFRRTGERINASRAAPLSVLVRLAGSPLRKSPLVESPSD